MRDLVGDRAEVTVLMPDGIDPHDYRPSAKDVAKLEAADAVVTNGLGLEEGLEDAVGRARDKGVPVFAATDHVALRTFGADEVPHGTDDQPHEERVAGGEDPHIWVDPLAMRDAMGALAVFLRERIGLDLSAEAAAQRARLDDLDARTRQTLEVIPPDRRLLVTGHESLGYFADRYGFRLVGAIIPATTSQAAPSAGELADLEDQIRRYQVPVVFNEIGTPPALSEAISRDTGVRVVELATHTLPADGQYATFIQELAAGIRGGLAPAP
ncbi:MAG: metal ABC transporter substrate-binding protein [Acidimicrobiales bacterium]